MSYRIRRAHERGYADHGWLQSFFSFSFASYYDPRNMNFGALRVLNDDCIQPKKGFGNHAHAHMEIITVPLSGELEHKDNLGHATILKYGDVQVMSAGTGIEHSESNPSEGKELTLVQLWIETKSYDISPRHEERSFEFIKNGFTAVASGNGRNGSIPINQDAEVMMGVFEEPFELSLSLQERQGLYFFIIDGEIEVGQEILNTRDAMGVWDVSEVHIRIMRQTRCLVIRVPM